MKTALAALQAERDKLDKECSELANRLGDVHLELDTLRSETSHDSVTQSNDIPGKQEIIDLLIEATKLKANAGGAIKGKIRQAIELLSTTK
jgi:ABC-type phosphate transport system auxiliary subunit